MKKRIIIILSVLIFVTIGGLFIINHNKSLASPVEENKKGTLAIMVYDEMANDYIKQDTVPKGDYILNRGKTHCTADGEIKRYDNETGTLTYSLGTGDQCYVYFYPGKITGPIIEKGANLAEAIVAYGENNTMSEDGSWGIIHETFVDETTGETVDTGYRYEGSDYVALDGGNATDIVKCTAWNSCTFMGDSKSSTYGSYRYAAEEAEKQNILKTTNLANYVCFDKECSDGRYRIIGTFNENYDKDGDGQATDIGYLVKVIRDELIKTSNETTLKTAFNANNIGYWTGSDLEAYLNVVYAPNTFSLKEFGVLTKYHLGNTVFNDNVNNLYLQERGTTVHDEREINILSTYALIYPSDYAYAVLASDCARNTATGFAYEALGDHYDTTICSQENWMYYVEEYNSINWWTVTPCNGRTEGVFAISYNGHVGVDIAYGDIKDGIRPSFYLKPETKVISGSGTKDNPYILGL